ncbi:Alpha/Beta hydrolase protein [Podospora didyma]|uniref:Alpha/Beta hydrolase protein n=1 Tax=Podospora didyma TaxID=330526 RepID=A0AAE0K1C1_9PEZI|nr:Alpha/Beta hydrolase protein [Podospora didyma]
MTGKDLSPLQPSLFVQQASVFEDLVVRCVRYAFANIPPRIGRVFFCKEVVRPFLRFRMLRHGSFKPPISWWEHNGSSFKGIWIIKDPAEKPDFVLYYAHGGGFSMGSADFYLEFLLSLVSLLTSAGYHNPAVFALEYTLVPNASFPTQLRETIGAYEHVLSVAEDPSIVCVSGDSAGATLILSLLLHLGCTEADGQDRSSQLRKPALALLVSPWVTLVSTRHKNTDSDYLDVQQLHRYGKQFAGSNVFLRDPRASPGCCKDVAWWRRASPSNGIFITYGKEEVFAAEIEELIGVLQQANVLVGSKGEAGGIHAWPVASLFLSSTRGKRLHGLKTMTREIRKRVPPRPCHQEEEKRVMSD